MPHRTQLPVYSPVSARALARAVRRAAMPGGDPRAALSALLARDYDAAGVLLTDSGTHALELAIRSGLAATGTRRAALPAYTCYDVATAAIGAGAEIVLYDIDPATLSPDPDSLRAALKLGARVVVISPLYGIPVEWPALEALAATHHALLIEDAAQGHGAAWAGRPLGSNGPRAILSFGRGKGWTGGAGGALLWKGDAPAHGAVLPATTTAAAARTLVKTAAQWALGRPSLYHLPSSLPWLGLGQTNYHPPTPVRQPHPGMAALVLATRDDALREAVVRRGNAAILLDRIEGGIARVRVPADGTAGYLRLPLRVSTGRAAEVADRLRHLGVAPPYPTTLAQLPAVRRSSAGPHRPMPGADALVRELITLPTHSLLSDRDLRQLPAELDARASDVSALQPHNDL